MLSNADKIFAQKGLTRPLSDHDIVFFALGSLGTGIFSTVPTVLLLYFCTETLHLPALWATTAVVAPKLWALFWDPFVGRWSDRSRSLWGRRRPFLLAGLIGVATAFALLFAPPLMSPLATGLWIGSSYFVLATAYSLFAVPYIGLPAELADSPTTRSRLVAWRISFAMGGVLIGGAGVPLLVTAFGGGRGGYAAMGLVVALGCAIAMSAPLLMLHGRDRARQFEADASIGPAPGTAWTSLGIPAFRTLLVTYALQLIAVGTISTSAPYLVTKVFFQSEARIGDALGALLVMTLLSIPVWSRVAKKVGDVPALAIAAIGYAVATGLLAATALAAAPFAWALVAFACVGAALGGLQLLPFTLLAHFIATDAPADSEGLFTGLWTAAEKVGLALGPAATGMAIAALGGVTMPGFGLFLAIVPAALALLSLIPLWQSIRN